MRAPITLDLYLNNFNYPGVGPTEVFDRVVDIAAAAERSGFGSVSVMDHLQQIPVNGPEENWMFDGPTLLAALAARTKQLSLGVLVGGVALRHPTLHAKITTTVDVISGGRAWHGIGAGWFEAEHRSYGFDYPEVKIRLEMVEEHVQIVRSMFTRERTTFAGKHFRADGAYNNPRPIRGDIPIVIGGSGERKTLRMVAQHADACNLFGEPARIRQLLGVLETHCEKVGRDPREITKTCTSLVVIARTHEAAQAKLGVIRELGLPERPDATLAGDPDTVGEQAQALADAGAEGISISMLDFHDPETLELAGQTISKVFSASVI
jgi:F420-dependent oxidoreductase-like protein